MHDVLLDEFAAWCELAMLCEGPLVKGDGWLLRPFDEYAYGGLCLLIGDLGHTNCRRRLHDFLRGLRNVRTPWWPRTRKGWDTRASFCWGMAEECEKEMTKQNAA